MFSHFAASALPGQTPLSDFGAAWLLWRSLRAAFPTALAACLMPNHIHIVLECSDSDEARVLLARLLAWTSRRSNQRRVWQRVPVPSVIPNAQHLLRVVRYVHLNPCRAKLARDPLEWPWSTHRGIVGAEVDPWVSPERMAAAVGWPLQDLPGRFHRYVSADPSVDVGGTPVPLAAPPTSIPRFALDRIVRAAASAAPGRPALERRAITIQLAAQHGYGDVRMLGRYLGISSRTVRRSLCTPSSVAVRSAELCLADARLLFSERVMNALAEIEPSRASCKRPEIATSPPENASRPES
ncbi:MAG: hypothetical protein U0263_19305 [Polyangiaceae bacterium]